MMANETRINKSHRGILRSRIQKCSGFSGLVTSYSAISTLFASVFFTAYSRMILPVSYNEKKRIIHLSERNKNQRYLQTFCSTGLTAVRFLADDIEDCF